MASETNASPFGYKIINLTLRTFQPARFMVRAAIKFMWIHHRSV